MTPSLSSTTKCSCRSWKPTSCSMHLPGWVTSPRRICTLNRIHAQSDKCACRLHPLIIVVFVFVAAHSLSDPTNTTQPLQVSQFASTRSWEQQRVHLPSEKPTHIPGHHDSSLQVSSAYSWQIIVLLGWLNWMIVWEKKRKRRSVAGVK